MSKIALKESGVKRNRRVKGSRKELKWSVGWQKKRLDGYLPAGTAAVALKNIAMLQENGWMASFITRPASTVRD
jgi:hypothetical protein